MPNVVKYTTDALPSNCLKKGNFAIGNNTGDYGLTFYNGITPPSGGYTIYLNKASGGPSIYCPTNDSQLITITNQIASANYTTAAQCLNYFAGQSDKICVNRDYEGIVTNGLVLNLDAGFIPSYPTTGTTWYDIGPNILNGTLTNGPTFNSGNGGSIVFDGVDDYVSCGNNATVQINQGTISAWVRTSSPGSGFRGIITKQNNYGLFTNNGVLVTYDWGNNQTRSTGTNIADNNWKNVAMSFTTNTGTPSNNAVIYLNGSAVLTTTIKILNNDVEVQLARGGLFGGSTQLLNGRIAQTQLYNRALSSTEILQNYNAQKGRFGL
jgi:hypothetical protein